MHSMKYSIWRVYGMKERTRAHKRTYQSVSRSRINIHSIDSHKFVLRYKFNSNSRMMHQIWAHRHNFIQYYYIQNDEREKTNSHRKKRSERPKFFIHQKLNGNAFWSYTSLAHSCNSMFFDMSLSFNQNSKQYVHVRAAWHESSVKGKLISFNFLCNKIPSRFKLHAQTLFQVSKLINGKSKWNLNIMLMRKFVKTIFVRFVRRGNLLERPTFRPDYHSIWIHKYVSINICVYTRSRISRERVVMPP